MENYDTDYRKDLFVVVESYRQRAVHYPLATRAQVDHWMAQGQKCWGWTDDGDGFFIVHTSPDNLQMACSHGESLEGLIESLILWGMQRGVPLDLILDVDPVDCSAN